MTRARFLVAAPLLASALVAAVAHAQQTPPQAPQLSPVLAGKKFTPPMRGEAQVQLMTPVTKREGANVVTRIVVKNVSSGPIARLTIDETWYDKGGTVVAGGRGVIQGLLQPDEVQTVTIQTPYDARMSSNNWNFSHVNGTVVPKRVPKIDVPKTAPATAGTTTPTPATAPKK